MFGRKINIFEKLLLPVGMGLTFFGFYLILLADSTDRLAPSSPWLRLIALFTWMMLLFIVILAATTEDMKEELVLIQKEHITEIKIMRELVHEQLQELRMLRVEMKPKK